MRAPQILRGRCDSIRAVPPGRERFHYIVVQLERQRENLHRQGIFVYRAGTFMLVCRAVSDRFDLGHYDRFVPPVSSGARLRKITRSPIQKKTVTLMEDLSTLHVSVDRTT